MELSRAQIEESVEKGRLFVVKFASEISMSEQQKRTLKVPKTRGDIWVAQTDFSPSNDPDCDALRRLVDDSIRSLSATDDLVCSVPSVSRGRAEWTAYRPGSAAKAEHPKQSNEETYRSILKDTRHDRVLLFLHGGVFFMNSPPSRHSTIVQLSRATGARCYSPYYRLAPQNPFPAALLDVLVAYMNLLYPVAGSLHKPVPASSIVFAGDSGGACLGLSLFQIILDAQSRSPDGKATVSFDGQLRVIPLPAGLTSISAAVDQGLCLPSYIALARRDCVPPGYPSAQPGFPQCAIWPADPPRGNQYCEPTMLSHPLVSPVTAKNWKGAPPLWFAVGDEALGDSQRITAQTAAGQGVRVGWEQWSMMPHTWPLYFPKWWQAEDTMQRWGDACKGMFEGTFEAKAIVKGIDRVATSVDISALTELTPERAERIINEKAKTMAPITRKPDTQSLL